MNDNERNKLCLEAKAKIVVIDNKLKELTDILEKLDCDYEMYLDNIDYSTMEAKKIYNRLIVIVKQDFTHLWR